MIKNYSIPASLRERLATVVAGRHYLIATDGACKGNPGRGGWGLVKQLWEGDHLLRQAPNAGRSPERSTTNVRMEMTAALRAIEGIAETNTPAIIVTDNMMLCNGMTKWLAGWKARGWRKQDGTLKNDGLWKALDAACEGKTINWLWVKGHSGAPLNELADTLADNAALGKYPKGQASIKATNPEWFKDHTDQH
ncbi:ribonuclease H [Brucella sp. NBRC 12951]|uniref:ribonuclease H family protein n=1 Tax=Brucella TaxID=234 RepID=UPI0015FB1060|nr:ribonuclease H [Brucella anthropi]MBA8860155.1 ribonuclease HI [Brucella anthropi]QTN02745.1 ribonuclease HI [Ochrobactrum sp. EEELCW01]